MLYIGRGRRRNVLYKSSKRNLQQLFLTANKKANIQWKHLQIDFISCWNYSDTFYYAKKQKQNKTVMELVRRRCEDTIFALDKHLFCGWNAHSELVWPNYLLPTSAQWDASQAESDKVSGTCRSESMLSRLLSRLRSMASPLRSCSMSSRIPSMVLLWTFWSLMM